MTKLDESASGKRRSFSQRVGTGGELAFRNLSHRQGLLCTKVEDDFGIDFMCQVDLDHLSRKASDIASTVVGACVRATTSAAGTVYLYPGDAENLLNSGTPLVFVLVHLTSDPGDAPVYHRLVDEAFIRELHEFLDSGASRLEVAPGECKTEDQFRASLAEMLCYGYSERVRVAVAAARVNSVLPNTTVEVRTRGNGQLTLVSTVDYYSLFERIDDEQERELLHAVFGAEEHITDRVAKLSLRPEVIGHLRSLPQPMIFAGLSRELDTSLRVVTGGESASEPFTYRAIGTHFGYVHAAGISLIISRARDRNGTWVHETELFVDPLTSNVMDDLGATLDFFALCSPGAKLYREDHDSETVSGFDVDAMFTALTSAAAMINAWRTCAQLDGWPARSVELKHFTDPEVFNTLVGFAHLLDEPARIASSSFVFRALPNGAEAADLERRPTTVYVPIIGNLAGHSIVLHLTVEGSTLSFEGDVVGFEFTSISSAECEARDRAEKSTVYPELVPGGAAPTLALGGAQQGVLPESLDDLRLGWIGEASE
jgi:hypothetical protein